MMTQTPSTGDYILKWRGDTLVVTLRLDCPRKGRAALRTNIGRAGIRRREIIDETELNLTPLARAWTDIPLAEVEEGVFRTEISLNEVGVFSFKACFFPEGESIPLWPDGPNCHVKVECAQTRQNNSIYTVFPRQFGSFREVARRLDLIMDRMGFRIIQTLPPFPVPTTYAVMGEYGCPFASLDFFSVDPAMAEFDEYATPLDQFIELIDAVHSKNGLFFIDLPANHTGWASTLQTHHPEWFKRASDGKFISPGAWGVTWADLVELDYSNPELRAYMADVFLFWCRKGVDGFRCDAGYMIPLKTWEYIVARVRSEFPATVFMLEGLGGDVSITDSLLAEANLDWAYSEIFQTYDRASFEWYLPQAFERGNKFGALVHFAETHDNDRLAKGGETYARMRVQLSALLSFQGAWGISNGVEWYATEKIDVHGKNDLRWGAPDNMVDLIARLNKILSTHPSFSGADSFRMVTKGGGNVLAVMRDNLLLLANLDVDSPAVVSWENGCFDHTVGFDLVTGRAVKTAGCMASLASGEVLCLSPEEIDMDMPPLPFMDPDVGSFDESCHFHWVYPRDVERDVVVPGGEWVEVTAPSHFRLALTDPATGRTLRARRSVENRVVFRTPDYTGDGTMCRKLDLQLVVYLHGSPKRSSSRLFIPPSAENAKMLLSLPACALRRDEVMRTVLSNGAGACAQVRTAWGEIKSQYDAFLAANPDKEVPAERINIWTRTRCWLQREGYTREFNRFCESKFTADPAGRFAKWRFDVPCGMGRTTAFEFTLSLDEGVNRATLEVARVDAGDDDVKDSVRIVFRPDIEWRTFHASTKAFAGAEELFPKSVTRKDENGFEFAPYRDRFVFTVENGVYHDEPQWTYALAHPEEAARAQEPSGDVFSPGWVSADLKIGEKAVLCGEAVFNGEEPKATASAQKMQKGDTLNLAEGLRQAMDLYIVRRNELKTVIAGYPWFLDWGRDTFIFMRGMIAAGMIDDSISILKAFAAFEENGTLPNIIYGKTAGNRDTVDAQLWFIRCVKEIDELGAASKREINELKKTSQSIVENYFKGTPNGIKVDSRSGLVWTPSHFTWMDTNYPACTPRMGYPVEIQALWVSALDFVGRDKDAAKARESVKKLFRMEKGYCDCLSCEAGVSAFDAVQDDAIRPNQLFLVTLGVVDDKSVLSATEELLVPGGIRSLNAGHPLYKGVYEGDEDTSRKQAYHNGTVWAWPFPAYAEALVMTGICSKDVALSLLASAVENINRGALCHISEIADGKTPHAQKGCAAQAWSVSELLRVWLKLSS